MNEHMRLWVTPNLGITLDDSTQWAKYVIEYMSTWDIKMLVVYTASYPRATYYNNGFKDELLRLGVKDIEFVLLNIKWNDRKISIRYIRPSRRETECATELGVAPQAVLMDETCNKLDDGTLSYLRNRVRKWATDYERHAYEYISVAQSCANCGSDVGVQAYDTEPSVADNIILRNRLGGMTCINLYTFKKDHRDIFVEVADIPECTQREV